MFNKLQEKARQQERKYSDRKRRFYDFLHDNQVGVLSSITPDLDPHGVVIYFTVDEDFGISFLTRSETRKHENLKHNNRVALTIYDPDDQATLQLVGEAQQILDNSEVNRIASEILMNNIKSGREDPLPITKLDGSGTYVGYRINPKQMRMAVYARPDHGEYSDIFESIESYDLD